MLYFLMSNLKTQHIKIILNTNEFKKIILVWSGKKLNI
jgi:hypothetical protein